MESDSTSLRFGISESILNRMIGSSDITLVAGKLKSDTEFVFFIVPLWFNIVSQYLVATEKRFLVATKTLWSGVSNVITIDYEDVYSIATTVKKKKLIYTSETDMHSKLLIRFKSGDMIELKTTNHALVKAIGDTVATYLEVSTEP